MPTAVSVAKCFFDLRKKETNQELGFVKIQKLVYFAHTFYLGTTDQTMIEEPLEAWQWGPIFPSLYHCLLGQNIPQVMAAAPAIDDEEIRSFIGTLERLFRPFTTLQLSVMAHIERSPWYETVTKTTGSSDTSVDFLRKTLPAHLLSDRETILRLFGDFKEQSSHGGVSE